VVTVSGNRHEVDHADALAVNDGVALLAGPGGVPVIFDYEGVSEVIGDLSGREAET
jgi:carbamate kinase